MDHARVSREWVREGAMKGVARSVIWESEKPLRQLLRDSLAVVGRVDCVDHARVLFD